MLDVQHILLNRLRIRSLLGTLDSACPPSFVSPFSCRRLWIHFLWRVEVGFGFCGLYYAPETFARVLS
jgi:hypothetical protein